ncbi:MAG: NUDIX hydrolase [Gemmatimonadota bacterium]
MRRSDHGDDLDADLEPLASRKIWDGRIVQLSLDTVRFPDGSTGELEMIRHSGAAAVLPVLDPLTDPDPRILLIHQFRYAAGGNLLEVPAGRPDRPGEPWADCAQRELQEETGYIAGELVPLTSILTTPGFTDERIHLFLATDLRSGTTARDRDEFMETVTLPISAAIDLIHDGMISDAKSICALLFARRFQMRQRQ